MKKNKIFDIIKSLSFFLYILLSMSGCEDYTQNYPVPPASTVPKFSYESTTGFEPPDTVYFFNESIIPGEAGSPEYTWDFGDSTFSNEENPVHIFKQEGVFTIKLTIETSVSKENRTASQKLEFIRPLKGDTLFFEDFEGLQLIPSDWVLVNLDGNTPDNPGYASMVDSAWIVYQSGYFDSKVAMGISFYAPEAAANDFMILPKVTLGNNSVLSWDAMSLTTSGNYPDSYQVRISTTTQDVEGCIANPLLYKVIDESWGDDIASNPGEGIKHHQVELKEYAGQDVYIAFRLNTPHPGGDRLAIDNILILEP